MAGGNGTGSPGTMIAAARRQRGLSVNELAERTRIPPGMLAAIEADEFHRLSGPLYARSFLRTCATELGLDPAEVLAAYARESGEPARAGGAQPPPAEPVRIRRVGLPWGRIAVGAALVAAAGFGAFMVLRPGAGADADSTGVAAAGAGTAGVVPAPVMEETATGQGIDVGGATGASRDEAGDRGGAVAGVPEGLPGMTFADGLAWPLVARLRVAAAGTARARRDGEAAYLEAEWPGGGGAAPAPGDGIVAGRAYADGDGLVVYWGAVERLSLVLGDLPGAELTVNGRPWPLAAPPGGGEFVVDVDAGPGSLP